MRCDSRTLVAQQVLTVLERHACGPQPSTEGVLQIVLLRFISMGFIDGTAAVVVTDSSGLARPACAFGPDPACSLGRGWVVGTYLRGLANVRSVCAKKTVYWRINLI